jgi:GNAT superfamily N-acetyltransferase
MLAMREATQADLPAVIELLIDDELGRLREDSSLPLDPGYLAAFDAIARDPNQYLFVAERDGARWSAPSSSPSCPASPTKARGAGQIEAVRIAADLRGGGLGAQMVEWAIARCRARGCRIVQLSSNATRTRAHGFYARLGFVGSHLGMKLTLTKGD